MAFDAKPVLRIFSPEKAREFYLGFLGFEEIWTHAPPGAPCYFEIARDGLALHLTEHHGDCTPGALVFVETVDIAALHAELAAKAYPFNRPGLEPAPWGGRMMETTDPFMNRLRFWQP
jgi:hypothetical protein